MSLDSDSITVVGADACRAGWLGAELENRAGSIALRFGIFAAFADLLSWSTSAQIIAVDIPIGVPEVGPRQADLQARAFVGRRSRSVFLTPPRVALDTPDYEEAKAIAERLTGKKISKQAYGLGRRIFEVERCASEDARIREIHPEVSFIEMAGRPLRHVKNCWNGLMECVQLLATQGLVVPRAIGKPGEAGPDDVVDAVSAAWSAQRMAIGRAGSLPARPEPLPGRPAAAIWY